MSISFLDLHWQHQSLKSEFANSFNHILESSNFILGKELETFEKEFASFCGAKYCLGVGNGLDALRISLQILNIGPGDEVIVPANTFIATWFAVSQVGAKVIPIDSDIKSFNINILKIEEKITNKTKAIMPVHLYGHPVQFDEILHLKQKYNLSIIEDAAQAHGATFKDKMCGSIGDIGCFSFYPGKNLGALGDGGAIVIKDNELLASKAKFARNYGSTVKYHHEQIGTNSRLDEIQAAFLRKKLKMLNQWNQKRKEIADVYLNGLENVPGIILPQLPSNTQSSWHLFVLLHEERGRLQDFLESKGIQTLIHYPIPPHRSGAYKESFDDTEFPVTSQICNTTLSLPMGPHLSIEDIDFIVKQIKKF